MQEAGMSDDDTAVFGEAAQIEDAHLEQFIHRARAAEENDWVKP